MKNKHNNIINAHVLLAVVLGFVVTLWSQSSSSQDAVEPALSAVEGTEPQDTWTKYQIILQRNIFSRQRGPTRQRQGGQESRPVVTANPESYFLLKGIVQEDGTFIAFIEDTRGNSVFRVREGDSIARGLVKNFTLDSIEYQLEDRTTSVAVGRDLEGGQGALTRSTLSTWSATSSPTGQKQDTTKETTPSGDEAEILRQLMEQRKKQLGQ